MTAVVILTCSTGLGHVSVAQSLVGGFRELGVRTSDLTVVDLSDLGGPRLAEPLPVLYRHLSRHAPWAYDVAFTVTNGRARVAAIAAPVARVVSEQLSRLIERHNPSLVVVTHPLFVSHCLGRVRKNGGRFRIASVVTDPVNPHSSWASAAVDSYFVCDKRAEQRLLAYGARGDRIREVPYPIRPEFANPIRRREARELLGLDPAVPVALVTGGGNGSGGVRDIVKRIRAHRSDVQPLILEPSLAVHETQSLLGHGPTEDVARLMAAANVIAGKAGPSTVAEAAAVGTPFLVTGEVGLQEHGNTGWAVRMGAALDARGAALIPELDRVLSGDISWMNSQFDPSGATAVARHLLGDLDTN